MSTLPRPDLPHVIVVGGGAAGLACAWRLGERGAKVTVLDPRRAPHDEGSHGGFTRVTRHAYHEGTSYVPLVREADDAWCGLERTPGELLVRTGMIEFGPVDDADFMAVLEACRACDIEHTMLDAAALRERYPVEVPDAWQGCFTPSGGYLRVGACLEAMRARAEAHGAQVRTGARAVAVEPGRVVLEDGHVEGDHIVLAAGVGTPSLMPDPGCKLSVVRRLLFWIRPRVAAPSLPVWGAMTPGGFFYGFPHGNEGVLGMKLACHTSAAIPGLDEPIEVESVDRSLRPEDWAPVEAFLRAHLPSLGTERIEHKVCMYTVTPSWDFLVDRHPSIPRLTVVSGLSGHGFKFAPALGRLAAALVLDGEAAQPEFAWSRHV
ncbi:MAG: N-methyl-L-tryptophan oxidase [Nannocystaceae bacterium]|nr:N-methyl-L-tryptophan oxidase [bacterium]